MTHKENLEKFLKQTFLIVTKNLLLYRQALTHRSYLNESKEKTIKSYERLEFLGDAVISFLVSQKIYQKFPQAPEGDLTNLRSAIVKTESLTKIAQKLGLGKYLLLSKGEEESGGRDNPSILADSLEALIAAVFLDQGTEKVKKIFDLFLMPLIDEYYHKKTLKDYKSLLQEISQEKLKISPSYKIIKEEGPDHKKIFTVVVMMGKERFGLGTGYSKQEAEEKAAQKTLENWR